ncbi:Inner centromere protein [Fukomys damarensis]|uniref:Inner centromere protein n=1 Tax=Fukomys damarensis TaxID=885580 RepID=A0A091DGP8_FUKDA|nr:Inner centromere protein [Fukomys damarensis]
MLTRAASGLSLETVPTPSPGVDVMQGQTQTFVGSSRPPYGFPDLSRLLGGPECSAVPVLRPPIWSSSTLQPPRQRQHARIPGQGDDVHGMKVRAGLFWNQLSGGTIRWLVMKDNFGSSITMTFLAPQRSLKDRATMGTTAPGPIHLLDLCDQKLMDFVCNMDNKDLVWLKEIEEEAERMFTREFSKEPELMPKTPSQKNRRKKRRVSYVQDENRDPIRKRSSRRKIRSGRLSSQHLRGKDKAEKLAAVVGEQGSPMLLRRVTRAAAAAAAASRVSAVPSPALEPPMDRARMPVVEIGTAERHSAEQWLARLTAVPPTSAAASQGAPALAEELTPDRPGTRRLESVTVSALKCSVVAKQEGTCRRSSKRIDKNMPPVPAASARIICHSYLERLLNVEVPQRVGPRQEEPSREAEPMVAAAEPEDPGSSGNPLLAHSAAQTTIHTPDSQPAPGGQEMPPEGQQGVTADDSEGHQEPPQSVRRKRSYKRAMSDPEEEPSLADEELQPLRNKTPSPPCPASKVVRPLRTFLHTVQRNQLLMTPSSAPRATVLKSFIKRNTPLRVDPKCSFVEKERQRLESLRRKEEAEQLRKQKVEEEKRRRREEEKLVRLLQGHVWVALQAKEERQAEEKAKKKAMAKKMEEAEARRRQEEEARRLRWQQQEEEERRHQELLQKRKEEEQERQRKAAEARRLAEQPSHLGGCRLFLSSDSAHWELQERERALRLQRELEEKKAQEEQQRLAEQRLQEEQDQKAREAVGASKALNVTVDVQSPACTSYQMTPQGHRRPPKIDPDSYCNYGMDLNSDDSTDDEAQPRKPIPSWARGTQLSQAIVHQYYHPPSLAELFGTIAPLDLEDIFKKSKPRYHKRTSSAVWNSPPLQGARLPGSLACSLKKY